MPWGGERLLDLGGAMRRRHESCLKGGGCEVDASRKHGVEKTLERCGITLHDFSVTLRRSRAEVNPEHAAHRLRREHDVMFTRSRGETVGQGARGCGKPVEESGRCDELKRREAGRYRDGS